MFKFLHRVRLTELDLVQSQCQCALDDGLSAGLMMKKVLRIWGEWAVSL
jgi:hypothetical protein